MHIATVRDIAIIVFVASTMLVNVGAYVRAKLHQLKMTRRGRRK